MGTGERRTGVNEAEVLSVLSPLEVYALLHLRMAGVDYAKSIAAMVGRRIDEVVEALEKLEGLGLVERSHGLAIKNTQAKLKLSHEVRKHHTYYRLTRRGEHLARALRDPQVMEAWLERLTGRREALRVLLFLREARHEHVLGVARAAGLRREEAQELIEKLVEAGLVAEVKPKTLKARHRRAKPKKETRCLHKYYRLTELAEMLLRRLR